MRAYPLLCVPTDETGAFVSGMDIYYILEIHSYVNIC